MLPVVRQFFAKIRQELAKTFRSLANPTYRLFCVSQLISLTGTQTQTVALMWLSYKLTESAAMLGLVTALTSLPVLFLSIFGGLLADRYDRKKILMTAQFSGFCLAATLAALYFTENLSFSLILVMGSLSGLITAFEIPARQGFVHDVVGGKDMVNAVSLNSMLFNSTRMLGPSLGALVLMAVGEGYCFAINAASYLAALGIFMLMAPVQRITEKVKQGAGHSLKEGFVYVSRDKTVRNVLVLTGMTSLFAFQYGVLLPVVVDRILHADAATLGVLSAFAAGGSLVGNIFLANRGKKEVLPRMIGIASLATAASVLLFASASSYPLLLFFATCLGLSMSVQLSSSNSLVQLTVPTELRGRVMSIYMTIMVGSVPLGSYLIGNIADVAGVRYALLICGSVCMLSAFAFNYKNR